MIGTLELHFSTTCADQKHHLARFRFGNSVGRRDADPIDPQVWKGSSRGGNKKNLRFAKYGKYGTQRPMNTPKVYSKRNPKSDSNNFKPINHVNA